MNGGAELVLSATSLKTFLRCPKQYEFSHIERIKSAPSIKQKLGIAVHHGVEHNYRQKLITEIDEPEDVMLDAYSDSYDLELLEIEKPDEDPAKAKDDGVKLSRIYHRRVAPEVQPLWVERQTQLRLISDHVEGCDRGTSCSCGRPFSVTIDLVDQARQVRDTKTTARTPSQGQHLMQVAAGAIGFEAETGEIASDLIVDTLIRKKVPDYHQDRWGGPVDKQMRRVFAKQVSTAYTMIEQGLFPTSGVEGGPGGPCTWCGYGPKGSQICPAWRKRK